MRQSLTGSIKRRITKTLKWWTGSEAGMPGTGALYGILKYPEDLSQAVSIGNAVLLRIQFLADFPQWIFLVLNHL